MSYSCKVDHAIQLGLSWSVQSRRRELWEIEDGRRQAPSYRGTIQPYCGTACSFTDVFCDGTDIGPRHLEWHVRSRVLFWAVGPGAPMGLIQDLEGASFQPLASAG
jgi:hypothetical protein